MLEDFCRLVFQLFLAGSGLYFTWISCCAFGPLFCGISGSLSFLGGVAISKINVKNSLVPPPTCKNFMYIRNLSMQFYPLSVTTVTRLPNLCKGWRFSLGLFGLLWSPLVCPRIWEPAGLLAYLGWPWLWEGGLAVLSSCRLVWLCFREIAQAQEQKQKCRAFFKPGLCAESSLATASHMAKPSVRVGGHKASTWGRPACREGWRTGVVFHFATTMNRGKYT